MLAILVAGDQTLYVLFTTSHFVKPDMILLDVGNVNVKSAAS